MEKVKIKSVIDSGKKWNEKTIFTIELEDGRTGTSFEPDALKWKGEMELDIRDGKEYQGVKQLIFNLPKQNNSNQKGFAQKDFVYEKRKASLECAIDAIKVSELQVKHEQILTLADTFFAYLNKK